MIFLKILIKLIQHENFSSRNRVAHVPHTTLKDIIVVKTLLHRHLSSGFQPILALSKTMIGMTELLAGADTSLVNLLDEPRLTDFTNVLIEVGVEYIDDLCFVDDGIISQLKTNQIKMRRFRFLCKF